MSQEIEKDILDQWADPVQILLAHFVYNTTDTKIYFSKYLASFWIHFRSIFGPF